MIAFGVSSLSRVARRVLHPRQEQRQRAVADLVRALAPRIILYVGMEDAGEPGSLLTCCLDCARTPRGDGKTVRIWEDHPASFLAAHDLPTAFRPAATSVPPNGFLDLVAVNVDRYPEERTIRTIVARTRFLFHTGTVILLLSRRRAVARRSADLLVPRSESSAVPSQCVEGHAMLLAPSGPRRDSAGDRRPSPIATVDDFLNAHRHEPLVFAPAVEPCDGAPGEPSTSISPLYRDLGACAGRFGKTVGGNRTIGSWWDKELQTLPATVARRHGIRFARANGHRRSLLIDGAGRVLPDSFSWMFGYGPAAVDAARTSGATYLVDPDGRHLPPRAAPDYPVVREVEQPALLLGNVDSRFGHALLETLSRAWAIDWALSRQLRVVLWADEPMAPFQRELIDLLGLPAGSIDHAAPGTLYRTLFIPSEGFRMMNSFAPIVATGWRRLARAAERGGDDRPRRKNIYLSRRGQTNRSLLNEDELEAFLVSRGLEIVTPEALSLAEQIRTVAGADAAVACFGSQSHLSIFMRPGTRRLIVAREHFNGPEETLISIANGSDVSYYIEPERNVKGRSSRTSAWTLSLASFAHAFDHWHR